MTPAVQTENGSKFKKRMNRKYTLVFCVIYWISGLSRVKAQHLKLGVFLESEENYFRRLNSTQLFFDFEIIRVNQSVTPYQTFNDLLNDVEKFRKLAITALIGNYSFLGSVLSAELNIPYYVLNLDQNSAHKRNMLEVDFSDNVLADVYDAILNNDSYENVLIFADSKERANAFLKKFTRRYVNVLILKGNFENYIEDNLYNARGTKGKPQAFVLNFAQENSFMIETIFNKAIYLNVMNSLNLWLIPQLYCDPKYLLPFARTVANIVTLVASNATLNNPSVLREAILRDSLVHLMTAFKSKSTNSLVEKARKTSINAYSSNYLSFDDNGKRIDLNLNAVGPRNSLDQLIKLGEYIEGRTPYPFVNTYNGALLFDTKIRIGVYIKRPYFYYKNNGQIDGFSHTVILELAKRLNLDFTYVMIPDKSIGVFNNITNKWNGALNMLQNNQIDICGILGTKSDLRTSTDFADYSSMVLDSGYNMLIYAKKPDQLDFIKLFAPFSWFLWFFIIILGLFMTFILWIIDKISPNNEAPSNYTFANAGMEVFRAFVMAKMSNNPSQASKRLFFCLMWIGPFLIVASYSATLAGLLLKNPVVQEFADLKTLYSYGIANGYKWIFRNNSETVANFLDEGGEYANLVKYAQKNWPNEMYVNGNNADVLNALSSDKDTKTIYIDDGLTNDFMQYAGTQNCSFRSFGKYEKETSLVFYMRKDLPQIYLLKNEIKTMIDSKLIGKYKELYFKTGICTTEHMNKIKINNNLSIKMYVGIFILLGIGLLVALVVAFFEFIIHKIALCIQRAKYSKLEFSRTYNCNIDCVTKNGINIQIPSVSKENSYFVSLKDLGIIDSSKEAMEESGVEAGKKIKLVYKGNDPHSGAKVFKKIEGNFKKD